jgi:uncharacterized protein YdhG (YjbR/CyaY superfamily)
MKKSTVNKGTIDEYLASLTKVDKGLLESLCKIIKTIVPDTTEEISYGIPTFRYKGKYLVGFGAAKNFCSLYAYSGSTLGDLMDDLREYECTKSAIHFTSEKPLSKLLIKKIVIARIAENEKRAKRKKAS